MKVLDQGIALEDERKRAEAERVKAVFDRDVTARLKSCLDGALLGVKETREVSGMGLETVRKVRATPYATDQTLDNLCRQIEAAVESVSTVESAVKEYKQLGPKNILLKSGEININRPNQIYYEFLNRFRAGHGRRRSIESCIKQIEGRLTYLINNDRYRESQPPPVVISPPDPPAPPTTPTRANIEFDARVPHGTERN